MLIKQFRYLTTSDAFDLSYNNWSRGAEYTYVLNAVKEDKSLQTIHNTSCGFAGIHLDFARRLEGLDRNVRNSDANTTDAFNNFEVYNILKPHKEKFDLVINISTIEDFLNKEMTKLAISNLLEQTSKRLIITADAYDRVDVEWFWSALHSTPYISLDTQNALTGWTSPVKQNEFSHIKILLIDVIK